MNTRFSSTEDRDSDVRSDWPAGKKDCETNRYPHKCWPRADRIALTPVDTFTATHTMKKAGEVVLTDSRVISKDGKR